MEDIKELWDEMEINTLIFGFGGIIFIVLAIIQKPEFLVGIALRLWFTTLMIIIFMNDNKKELEE